MLLRVALPLRLRPRRRGRIPRRIVRRNGRFDCFVSGPENAQILPNFTETYLLSFALPIEETEAAYNQWFSN